MRTMVRRGAVLVEVAALLWILGCEPPSPAVKATLYRAEPSRGDSDAYVLESGERVVAGDALFLEVEVQESRNVYVLSEDASGATSLIFPCQGLEARSRLEPGYVHRLPSALTTAQTYWSVEQPTARERLWVVAGERPVAELEELMTAFSAAAPCAARLERAGGELLQALRAAVSRESTAFQEGNGRWRRCNVKVPAGDRADEPVCVELIELIGQDEALL